MTYLKNQSNGEECVTIFGLILALSPGCNKNTVIFDIGIQKLPTNDMVGHLISNQYHHHQSSIINHQSSISSSIINHHHQSSIINHQSLSSITIISLLLVTPLRQIKRITAFSSQDRSIGMVYHSRPVDLRIERELRVVVPHIRSVRQIHHTHIFPHMLALL